MNKLNARPLIVSGVILGIGMGGFFDGILLHQILQVHNMLSNTLPPDTLVNMEINMFWDGLFHTFTWLMTLFGIFYLWHAMGKKGVPRSTEILVGAMLSGWGIFNFVEGVINHQVLKIHHVIQRAPTTERFILI